MAAFAVFGGRKKHLRFREKDVSLQRETNGIIQAEDHYNDK